MNNQIMLKRVLHGAVCVLALLGNIFAGAGRAQAAESDLAATLCGVLKKVVPEVRTFKPEGAQAQLVMAIADAFNMDPAKLRQVRTEIDPATTAHCPKDRESMLAILKMKSLSEAVR